MKTTRIWFVAVVLTFVGVAFFDASAETKEIDPASVPARIVCCEVDIQIAAPTIDFVHAFDRAGGLISAHDRISNMIGGISADVDPGSFVFGHRHYDAS